MRSGTVVSGRGGGDSRTGAVPGPAWTLLLGVVGTLAWLRIFTTWFSQDDFHWLLRAAEGAPVEVTTPRLLSMSLYFRAAWALFEARPALYHGVHLALLLASGWLLFRVLARSLPAGAAAAAAAVFLTSPALFDTLHWISAIADLLCVTWLLLAVWLLTGGGPARGRGWLAIAAYALALASKEIAVGAAPVLALLHLRQAGAGGRIRALVSLALAVLFALPAAGAWQTGAGEPYALAPGAALANLPAYATAAVLSGLAHAEPSDLAWARLPWVRLAGLGILAAWLAGLLLRRSGPAWLGFAWFLGLLAPVAMLERQFHFFYLTCALPGLVASVAFQVMSAPGWVPPRAGWLVGLLVLAQVAAIEARATSRLARAPLPTDFVLRRAVIARNAVGDLAPRRADLASRVVMLGQQPVDAAWRGASTTEATDYTRDPWWDENVRGALFDGEALRLLFPNVREVVFKPWLEPEDTSSTIAAYRIDGHLGVADYATFVGRADLGTPATLAGHLERAADLIRRRLFHEALRELTAAEQHYPDQPDVLVNLGALQVQLGDSAAALATLARAVQVTPGDIDARYNLGVLQWRLGRREEARATWAPMLTAAPESDLSRSVRDLLEGRAR